MRIQHNIMAMSAYRNYTNNVAAMKKNLEKLSSGYKINRAGDDAAGLAISEKMRAQITGLETAQKNAKDGISLVQTAEGALTEVHDMLNRMVELATMSANGTYDNTTDRAQLQKEMDQLTAEINRIADSSNFNGIKLLNGDLNGTKTVDGMSRIIDAVYSGTDPISETGKKTILDGGTAAEAKATKFNVNLNNLAPLSASESEKMKPGTMGTSTAGEASLKTGSPPNSRYATFNADKNALLAAIENSTDYEVTDFEDAAEVSVQYDTDKWVLKVGTTEIDGVEASFADGTMTFKSGDTTLLTIGARSGSGNTGLTDVTEAEFKAGFGTATNIGVTYTADADAVQAAKDAATATPEAAATITLTVGGEDLVADLDITGTADAKTMATQILAELDDNDVDADIEGTQVKIGDVTYTVSDGGDGILTFELADDPTADNVKGNYDVNLGITTGDIVNNHTAGTTVIQQGSAASAANMANTVFKIEATDIKDGTKIKIDDKTLVLAVGKDSTVKAGEGELLVNLKDMEATDDKGEGGSVKLDIALGRMSEKLATGTENFIVGVNDKANGQVQQGLTIHRKLDAEPKYDTKEKLAEVFSITSSTGKGLTLQIGDTAEDFNQLKVDIKDMHASSLGLDKISIADQDSAAAAVDVIKAAINSVSDVRGTLGATQNRLDHTINNLSVMTENIQDAESTIRDVDVAEEMMAYTKNNILIQSAQAMLAQANQVPQGVLQLLQ